MLVVRASLVLALCAGLAASPAATQSFANSRVDRAVKPVSVTGGILSKGTIVAGENFTVDHAHKGDYLVHFKAGQFAGLPVFSCTPIGETSSPPICIVWAVEWTNGLGPASAEFRFFTSDTHVPVNSGFMFTEFTTKTTK